MHPDEAIQADIDEAQLLLALGEKPDPAVTPERVLLFWLELVEGGAARPSDQPAQGSGVIGGVPVGVTAPGAPEREASKEAT